LGVEELLAYKKAFAVAMDVFEVSKTFPKEERYSLTDQIRRSSRAVCANLSEAYRKRRYVNHFISKLTDADAENAETQTWIIFAEACNYISEDQKSKTLNESEEVGKLLNFMINNPIKFGVTQKN
jgi:four helix bundle protein